MSALIDVYRGGQSESWLVVHDDGRIIYHSENDGYAFLRHGAEAIDEEITLEQVADLERTHSKTGLVRQVEAALAKTKAQGVLNALLPRGDNGLSVASACSVSSDWIAQLWRHTRAAGSSPASSTQASRGRAPGG
jgi:hypothetical protein